MERVAENKNQNNVLSELARRGVYQAVGVYVAIAWGITEILLTASERLGWPPWLGDASLILFLTGLPFVILLSWAFDLTGSGLKRMEPGSLTGKAVMAGGVTIVLGLAGTWFFTRESVEFPLATRIEGQGRPVIAVMPFRDFVRDADTDILVTAFADELINRINAHPDLVALTFATVSNPAALAVAGELPDLPADYFVQGSFRPAPVGTGLQVRLVDRQGLVHWEKTVVRDFSDFREAMEVQSFLAGEVAADLGTSLTGIDYCEPSTDPQALALYYEARQLFDLRGPANVAASAHKLEEAIELDPGFARAHDLLGSVYERFHRHVMQDPSQYGMSAEELQAFLDGKPEVPVARRALDLCPSLGAAYVALELSAPVHHSQADLIDLLVEGLRRDPGNTPLMDWAVDVYQKFGHHADARAMAEEFLVRDPLNPRAYSIAAMAYSASGDFESALNFLGQSLEMRNEIQSAGLALAYDRFAGGQHDAMLEGLGDFSFSPGKQLPFDPRLLVGPTPDLNQILAQLDSIERDDFNDYRNLFGFSGGDPWLFELGDEVLSWQMLEDFADMAPAGVIVEGAWSQRWIGTYGKQSMVELMDRYTAEHRTFWDRHGPPDGCSWEEGILDCTATGDADSAL